MMAQLDYMEKRGSGLKKICNATKELETYKEGRDPVFKSSVSQFMTVIYSMEYEAGESGQLTGQLSGQLTGYVNGGVNGYVNGDVNTLTASQKLVFDIVRDHPGIKTKQIADVLNKSPRTIEKHLSFLTKANLIEHRDSDKTGGYYAK